MSVPDIRYRQIHLDFHTSELVEGVGRAFDAEQFAQTLEKARVNSINLFSRCHHGMLYYDSKRFPERVHPHLNPRDLLKQQVEACHRHNIHVNLYVTVRWDLYTVHEHPEWIAIDENGRYSNLEKKDFLFEPGFYTNLCWNSPYRQFLKEQIGEVLETIPFEGVWFDASFVVECACQHCQAGMKALGLDPTQKKDRVAYSYRAYWDFVRDMSALGVDYKGSAPYSPDFIKPAGKIGQGLPPAEHVMYLKGAWVAAREGSEVLAEAIEPIFNRTFEHFTSHAHSPSSGKPGYPAIVKNGRTIYFIHPIFTMYHTHAPRWCKQLFLNALEMLLPEPVLKHDGPSTILATLNHQAAEHRQVVHLLHYIPERRSMTLDIIEDVIPLYQLKVSVRADHEVKSVSLVPQSVPVPFDVRDGRVEFVVPKVNGHQMVSLALG